MKTQVNKLIRPDARPPAKRHYLSTGSTLLDLAVSGKVNGGFPSGEYALFIGDSDSGKTWICLACFAEAQLSKHFTKYRCVYDAPEGGAMMDIKEHFGKAVADKLEWRRSQTLEDFYYALDDDFKRGEPFILVLDSVDSLNARADEKAFSKAKTAARKQEEGKGSYGMAKAKVHSEFVRKIPARLKETGSILIVINQTRDNVNAGPFGPPKTRSGGRALEFFASVQLWSSVRRKVKVVAAKVGNSERKLQTGILCRVQVRRSRITGKDRTVDFPISNQYGIDDVGGMVDYLCDWGHWKINRKVISATEFDLENKREYLIQHVEQNNLENELKWVVEETWNEIEGRCAVKRKKKYK